MDKGRFRVLLIEDDAEDYLLVKTLLSECRAASYHVDWVNNFEQGLLSLCQTNYDVCLLDYLLGARNGMELLGEALGRGCEVPIIMLTGHGDEDVDLEAMRAGAADYLVKELISRELLERSIRYSIARKKTETNLRKRTAELVRANEALRREDMRLQALWELRRMHGATEKEVADFILEWLVRITESQFGVVGFLDATESVLTPVSWSDGLPPEFIFQHAGSNFDDGGGNWAEGLTIVNDPESITKDYSCGCVRISRLMIVPFSTGERVVAVATVVNKKTGYEECDVKQARLMLEDLWRHIQHGRADLALRRSESLAALGRALSSVAHDIKTPLVAIGGFTQMVYRNLHEGSKDRERLDIVLNEAVRLEKMVDEMLDFSKPLELIKKPENPCAMVKEILSIVGGVADEKQVTLSANLRHCESRVTMDSTRMRQVLVNLIINAIQATPEGKIVGVNLHQTREHVVFDVIDCGSGIPRDQRTRVFFPFFTTKKEGTGLGLPIVKKIVDAHKGRVEILDNPQAGVTFRVTLPSNPGCKGETDSVH